MEKTIDEPESDTVPGLAGQNSELENISSPRGKNSLERETFNPGIFSPIS